MTSKDALEKICKDWGCSMAHAYKRCPWRGIPGEYCEEYETIKKDLEVLKKYHQIEEELGIDLITLFKGLKGGVYYFTTMNQLTKDYVWLADNYMSFAASDKLSYSFRTSFEHRTLFFQDYGKTWALTKEELL